VRANIYLHSSKQANWELGEKLGLTGEALMMFRHACAEVKATVEVDPATGVATIVGVDNWALCLPAIPPETPAPPPQPRACGQTVKGERCQGPALFRYTWPGRDEAFACLEHAAQLLGVAEAIGMHLQLTPLEAQ
jgi:hypothetical protein